MILRSLKLKYFQGYESYSCAFAPMTFIKGPNGSGKSTLGLDAVLFVLYGYTKKTLAELPTRNKSKSCSVECEIEHNGLIYTIIRNYPSSLTVKINGEEKKFATGMEAQKYIETIFGDVNQFKQFRMFDNKQSINFLAQGQQTLKKILFSVSDEIFNNVKVKLNSIKQEREIYNKEKAVIYSHYPSPKRLEGLKGKISNLQKELSNLENEDRQLASELLKQNNQKGQAEGQLKTLNWQLDQTKKSTHCYACKQEILPETKNRMLKEKEVEISQFLNTVKEANETIIELQEIKQQSLPNLEILRKHKEKINNLILKLEGRLKQKDYKYTSKDIEIVKRALLELDQLSTKYLTRSVKVLEPIINSILEKINFKVEFDVNDKGKFAINLIKEGIKYDYKELSTGQELLLQVAMKIALLMERGEEGLLIADEGFSSLDQENLLHVLNILSNFPFQLIGIIHHVENLPNEVKIIDLNKTN